ncbi:hypothetical protein CC761_20080 [Salmonella enterica subsp. enterica serovar Newport]|nr:hypothetical protein [Salmonella enterica subsp. enterica serovar Newport]EHX1718902.1 hypothetical protein [Salmonella enterica subsp. enterica serovar Newport]
MFKIIVTSTDHATGRATRVTLRQTYKTLKGAEKAAQRLAYVCSPDGKTITFTRDAEVTEVRHV